MAEELTSAPGAPPDIVQFAMEEVGFAEPEAAIIGIAWSLYESRDRGDGLWKDPKETWNRVASRIARAAGKAEDVRHWASVLALELRVEVATFSPWLLRWLNAGDHPLSLEFIAKHGALLTSGLIAWRDFVKASKAAAGKPTSVQGGLFDAA